MTTDRAPRAHAGIVGDDGRSTGGPGPDVMAAGTLEDDHVLTIDGDDIGKVTHIMLDVRAGRIAYAVVSSGGFLGIGDKLLAIPWNALTLDTDSKCFQLAMPAERVKNAPGFDKDHWPSMADRSWASSVHQFYGREPYWSGYGGYGGVGSDALGTGDLGPGSSDAPEAGGVKL